MLAMVTIGQCAERTYVYRPAPVDNPLKGLVPYKGNHADKFPHSMEFSYLALNDLVTGKQAYDWQPLEQLLNDVASRGHQTIFRVYLEYPKKPTGVPDYLIAEGLKMRSYEGKGQHAKDTAPDYEDPALRTCLSDFIAAMGERYDGDPRIAYITAGLLGAWGEWHTYPKPQLWASIETQRIVLDAYEKAFKSTPVLLRYPAGNHDAKQAANHLRPFGYHDDSFAWATLNTGKKKDSWFFESLMKTAGPSALSKWKRHPIGGEIRPEAWGKVFDPPGTHAKLQDFATCVATTHATWLMDSGLFNKKYTTAARRARAMKQVQRMGYELHVSKLVYTRKATTLDLQITVENRGIAPFYYDWPVEIALLDPQQQLHNIQPQPHNLATLLPAENPQTWTRSLVLPKQKTTGWHLVMRIPNPMPKGTPLQFANSTQDQDLPGWLTLLEF